MKRLPLLDITNYEGTSLTEGTQEFLDQFTSGDQFSLVTDAEACDRAVRSGTCESVVHRLRDTLALKRQKMDGRKAHNELGLQLAIICSTLARMLECSDETLHEHLPSFADDLGVALPNAIRNTITWEDDSTCRSVVLGCSVYCMRRVSPFCIEYLFDFAQILALLLGHDIPSDVRVDAACTLTSFLGVGRASISVHCKVEQEASAIISVLSTAALTNNKRNATDRLRSMLLLAKDPLLSGKLRRRRCVIIAVAKQLKQDDLQCQGLALEIISFLLKSEDVDPKSAIAANMKLLLELLEASVNEECCRPSQIRIIHALLCSFEVPVIERERKLGVLHTFYQLSRADTVQPNIQIEASSAFLAGVNKISAYREVFSELSVFVVSPLAPVRQKVIRGLDDAFFWHAKTLGEHTDLPDLLDSLCILISNGSLEDCANAMQLCRQMAGEDTAKGCMCRHKLFLQRLISLVASTPVKNRPAYINAVELILDLLESDERLPVFLPFPEVLPSLVGLANRTACDALKTRLVSAVLRFAKAKLEKCLST